MLLVEQAKLDDHEHRVTDLMSHLLNLGVGEEKVAMPFVAVSSKTLKKRLHVHVGSFGSELRSVNEKMGSLAPCPGFDLCFAQHLAKNISELKLELVDITRGLLLLEGDDVTLSKWAMRIKESLSDLSLKLKACLHYTLNAH